MRGWDWERIAPLTGVVAVILWITGVFVVESGAPDSDAPAAEILSDFDDNFATIATGSFLFALGTLFFVFFLGALRSRFRRAEGEPAPLTALVFGAGIGKAAFDLGVAGGLFAGPLAANEADDLAPEAAEALAWADDAFFVGAEFMAVAFMASAAAVVLRTRVLPAWTGWLAVAVAVGLLIVPIGWAFLLLGVPLWVLLASLLLWRGGAAPARTAAET